jgi:uncharacterized membrane protein
MSEQKIKGYIFGMLTAFCWAISPIFIHLGLQGLPSSIWATAIGLTVATAIYLIWLIGFRKGYVEISRETKAYQWQMLGGVTGGIGIMARNIALDFSSVAIVISLAQTAALFTLIFGPLIFRDNFRERISIKLIVGVLSIVAGSMLVIIGRNG